MFGSWTVAGLASDVLEFGCQCRRPVARTEAESGHVARHTVRVALMTLANKGGQRVGVGAGSPDGSGVRMASDAFLGPGKGCTVLTREFVEETGSIYASEVDPVEPIRRGVVGKTGVERYHLIARPLATVVG